LKILVFCKNTEGNKKALEVAVEQAKAFNTSVALISCIADKSEVPTVITEEITEKAGELMQEHVEQVFTPAGVDCTSEVIVTTASFGEEVVQYAEKNNIDTIIMSIQKRSKVGKVFFGSTSQYVILEAPCKVLTTK
jgi:nucleotide-binding universal stress UspA family protein